MRGSHPGAGHISTRPLPAGARVVYDTGPRTPAVEQQVWLIEGRIALTIGEDAHDLDAGDCLAMRVDRPIVFHNPHPEAARYLVALTALERSR